MKKIIAMLIACLMVACLVPVFAAPAAAAEKVVFVGTGGEGDGSTPDKPLGSLIDAYTAIGDNDGTIVFVDMYASMEEHRVPEHKGHITMTSVYNGVDYKGGIWAISTAHLILGGTTTFENLTFELDNTWVIRCLFNKVTFGEGITVLGPVEIPKLYVIGGDQDEASACDTSKDIHLTFKSGTYLEVIGIARNKFPSDITGKVTIEVSGADTRIYKLAYGCRNLANSVNAKDALVILDGGVIDCWVASGDKRGTSGFTGDVEIVLTKNFDITKSFDGNGARINGEVFNGISGSSAFDAEVANTLLGTATLLVDPAISSVITSSDKIHANGFTTVKEFTYTGTIGSGKLEADAPVVTEPVVTEAPATEAPATEAPATEAPATDAPVVTTATPAEPEVTPSTGDASVMVVFAAAAVVAIAAVVVLKKREN